FHAGHRHADRAGARGNIACRGLLHELEVAIPFVRRDGADREGREDRPGSPEELRSHRAWVGLAEEATEPARKRSTDEVLIDERGGAGDVDGLRCRARACFETAGEEVLAACDPLALAPRRERAEAGCPAPAA